MTMTARLSVLSGIVSIVAPFVFLVVLVSYRTRFTVTARRSWSMLVEYFLSSMKLIVLAIERTEVYLEAG